MKRSRLLFVTLVSMLAAGIAAAQTLDEILTQHFAAIGGKEKIQAVKSIRLTGKQTMGPQEVPFTVAWKRPDKIRTEFTFQGMTGIQAYDGTIGWSVMPFTGKTDAEKMGEEELKQVIDEADMIDGPLMDYKAKGHTVELLGKAEIEGTPAWKLKVTKKNGNVATVWLDADAMLEIRAESKRTIRGQEMEFESSIGDYKQVGGLYFAHSVQSKPKGAPQGGSVTIEKIELDPDLADSLFTMPAAKSTPAPAKPGA